MFSDNCVCVCVCNFQIMISNFLKIFSTQSNEEEGDIHIDYSFVIYPANGMQKWHTNLIYLQLCRYAFYKLTCLIFLHFVKSCNIDTLHIILESLNLFC